MSKMSLSEWKNRMQENPRDYGESSSALMLIIEQAAVCKSCRDDDHKNCTKIAKDIIARGNITCRCRVCEEA